VVAAALLADASLADSDGVLANQVGIAPQLQNIAGTVYGNAIFSTLGLGNLGRFSMGANRGRKKKTANRSSAEPPKALNVVFHFLAITDNSDPDVIHDASVGHCVS